MNESCRRGYYFDLLTTFSGSLVLLFSRNLFMEEKISLMTFWWEMVKTENEGINTQTGGCGVPFLEVIIN